MTDDKGTMLSVGFEYWQQVIVYDHNIIQDYINDDNDKDFDIIPELYD